MLGTLHLTFVCFIFIVCSLHWNDWKSINISSNVRLGTDGSAVLSKNALYRRKSYLLRRGCWLLLLAFPACSAPGRATIDVMVIFFITDQRVGNRQLYEAVESCCIFIF